MLNCWKEAVAMFATVVLQVSYVACMHIYDDS